MAGGGRVRHGTESYYVVGEGLLSESRGGRATDADPVEASGSLGEASMAAARLAAAPPFHFSRMGPRGAALAKPLLDKLARAMTTAGGGATGIPAGFTYLGQFIDHDLTFDKTKVMLGEEVTPALLRQARSPSLDLDSLYGAGPQNERSAKFYADDRHLKTGKTRAVDQDAAHDGFDLPRDRTARRLADRRLALIPEPRNDENLAVAQTHLAFIRFHNRVVDKLPAGVPAAQRFSRAREKVVKHYQWMIRHDYLPRICEPQVLDDVFDNGRKLFEVGAEPTAVPTMPVEFSVAAFRFGHSMIRSRYDWNRRFPDGEGTLGFLFTFSAGGGDLGGDLVLPSNWICDFRRLYEFEEAGRDDLVVARTESNRAKRIDSLIVDPLQNLPPGTFGGPEVGFDDPTANLAFRNLTRATMVRLASGQQMVAHLRDAGVRVRPLSRSQILNGSGGAVLSDLTTAQREALVARTPLWFYVLREAETNDGRLRGVGARILAETFHRAMEGSEHSIVRDSTWRPTLGPDDTTFRMVHLLLFAAQNKKRMLNPLGG
ncbi:MAG: Animal haem peroxidase [uncultured Nocardioidaceae bacterium]|uniref:Animal haem peroxidase n=1 Tax=uncultured Nocardioidaceae bacterium TaxID=253824 RepID=A0A6J4MDI7_9ACTN|nr:MAG: Animal haem peroxidase [uncultured Nocardioidaceae bacterium]